MQAVNGSLTSFCFRRVSPPSVRLTVELGVRFSQTSDALPYLCLKTRAFPFPMVCCPLRAQKFTTSLPGVHHGRSVLFDSGTGGVEDPLVCEALSGSIPEFPVRDKSGPSRNSFLHHFDRAYQVWALLKLTFPPPDSSTLFWFFRAVFQFTTTYATARVPVPLPFVRLGALFTGQSAWLHVLILAGLFYRSLLQEMYSFDDPFATGRVPV